MSAPPFEFHCQRSGRCCRHGEGYIWLGEGELEAIAGHLGLSCAALATRYLVQVGGRLSLRTEGGRCALLEGQRTCRVYPVRPAQCARFPFWPEILAGGTARRRAQEICPGMRPAPGARARELAFARLAELYLRLEEELAELGPLCRLRGLCCDFEHADHELYATRLESDYASRRAAPPAPVNSRLCPYWRGGRCHNRAGRPLGCRVYYCDPAFAGRGEELYERFHAEIRAIHLESGYPFSYGRFLELLPAGEPR